MILICVPLAFELVFLGVIGGVLWRSQLELERASRSREVVARANNAGRLLMQASAMVAAHTVSGNDELTVRFESTRDKILSEYEELQSLLRDKPAELLTLQKLRGQTASVLSDLEHFQSDSSPETVAAVLGDQRASSVSYRSKRLGKELLKLVVSEDQQNDTAAATREKLFNQVKLTFLLGLLFSAAVTIGLAMFFGREISLRLKHVIENAAKLASRAPLVLLGGDDEIADLDKAFHRADRSLRHLEKVKRGLTLAIADSMQGPLQEVTEASGKFLANEFGDLDEKTRNRIERAADGSRRLLKLVDDLRTADSAVADVGFTIDLQSVDLAVIVAVAVTSMSDFASERNVKLDVAAVEHVHLKGDRDRLIQVAVNLLSNAIKFSSPGGTVSVKTSEAAGFIELSVVDAGPGIAQEHQQKIFDLFEQVEASDAAEKGGSGLGLAICRDIVQRHGGTLSVSSQPGHGSTFTVQLPVEDNSSARLSAPDRPTAPERGS